MKKFFIAALVLATTVVNAAEITVLEAQLPTVDGRSTMTDTRFYINTKTMEGFAKVSVSEQRYVYTDGCTWDASGRCFPSRHRTPVIEVIFQETVKIDNLMLMGDKVIFHGAEGDVDCGTMGVSRVLKVPTLYLSGNCQLTSRVVGTRNNSKIVVKLNTK